MKSSYDELRESMVKRLGELEARQQKVDGDLRKLPHPDSQERAQQSQNDEVLEDLSEHDRHDIAEIRHALGRIDLGTYGFCERCTEQIPLARLKALPFARLCVGCAA